ncbi:bifunctional 3-deoxy-7-phosphoheptulonate synthase/chorismate mutase [Parvicella tangerina]|uniref:Phospho-2-dehydro-3-deoxyheptonate aldolase n=1 Tax=Parvicella tangerina TaxID=2829795 RepID=A0A916JNZ2_9FLAO|nr:bifunctional 3-deoxy-7-phosphoheptulonate synthase/chorismate mutase [Parvicella tangerina]CAG5083929.1 Phospho-2-dehydro-3-deoxyheptonate aldolase [Parvicella tangerina]
MIIQLNQHLQANQLEKIQETLTHLKIKSVDVQTQSGYYLVGIPKEDFDLRRIGQLDGVKDVHRITDAYKLVSRQWKTAGTVIDLGDGVTISERDFTVMAGPCSIESEEQIERIVAELVKQNVKIMRGGVYKPRSSPYSFRGLGIDGLKLFYQHCKANGIKIITEVMQVSQIEEMLPYVDIFQVGARNTQNFNLLDALGEVDKPVMIKRGISGSIDELLQSAEYVFSAGNEKLLLCERGIRTFENAYRNTFDINAIPILKEKSHLPVIADPSHGIGIRKHVDKITLAALAAGADGAIIEMHYSPEKAFSDGQQNLNFAEFEKLMNRLSVLKQAIRE